MGLEKVISGVAIVESNFHQINIKKKYKWGRRNDFRLEVIINASGFGRPTIFWHRVIGLMRSEIRSYCWCR